MRKRRTIIVLSCIAVVIAVLSAFFSGPPPPVAAAAKGRSTFDNGSQGFFFAVTNRSTRALEVMLARTDAPTGAVLTGYAYRMNTTMKPNSEWYPALYPPAEGVPWSVDVQYLRYPGKLESILRGLGARFHLCGSGSRWEYAQRIEIQR